MIVVAFMVGVLVGVIGLGVTCMAFQARARRRAEAQEALEEVLWDHPELAPLLDGKAPIRLICDGSRAVH